MQRSLSEYTAVVCGIEDCLAAGVKELEVHVTGGGGKMIVNQLGSEIAPGAGRHTRNPVAPCRGFVRRVQDLAMEFDSLIVRHRDEVDEQALHLAECGSGLLRPANDEPEGTVVAPCAALPALDGVDRVTLTVLRLLARCGEPQYTSFCAGALAVAVGGAAPAASAATDSGDNVKADTDWPFISELLARHSDPDDTFDINTNIATVIENIPKMATDMWGKVAYVCAIAMTDTDVDRQVLGCALWQLLPRFLLSKQAAVAADIDEIEALTGHDHASSAQAALLLLRYCAAPRLNHLLRAAHPADMKDAAELHAARVEKAASILIDPCNPLCETPEDDPLHVADGYTSAHQAFATHQL